MSNNPGDAHLPFFNTSHLGPPSTPSSMFTPIPVQQHPTRYPSPNPYPPRNFPMQVNSSAPPPYQHPPMASQPQPLSIVPQAPLGGDNHLAPDRSSSVWSGTSAGQMISRPGFASHVPYSNTSGPNLGFTGNVQPRQPTLQLPSSQMSHHSATPGSFPGQPAQPFARPSRPNFPAHFSGSQMNNGLRPSEPMSAAARPNEPNFFPMRQPSVGAVGPQHPVRGDFSFRMHHPPNPHNQAVLQPGGHPSTMNRPIHSPAAQAPPFRPLGPNSNLYHGSSHEFQRPQMGQPRFDYPFGGNPTGPSMPPRFAAFPDGNPQMMSRSMAPRPGYPAQMNLPREFRDPNQQLRPNFRPGRQQVYDPFSPSASQQPGMGRKADNDPEYEDLMSSMGLK
ncbi:hypothetical protein LINGRAHAP2_LOCUS16812 [Linum grandiflorum]